MSDIMYKRVREINQRDCIRYLLNKNIYTEPYQLIGSNGYEIMIRTFVHILVHEFQARLVYLHWKKRSQRKLAECFSGDSILYFPSYTSFFFFSACVSFGTRLILSSLSYHLPPGNKPFACRRRDICKLLRFSSARGHAEVNVTACTNERSCVGVCELVRTYNNVIPSFLCFCCNILLSIFLNKFIFLCRFGFFPLREYLSCLIPLIQC